MVKKYNKTLETGTDFSGVGAFDQALAILGIKQNKKFACDLDKFARQTYILNYGEPDDYPMDVYDRTIPKDSLDIYMTSPPCQGFSIAGNRKGSILFLNSYEFIKINKPRYFIFENVKGLLSHDKRDKELEYGNTFNQWLNYLGGKSVNGNPVIFPFEESVPYHIYHFVLNAKQHGIPQNRERVFIVGIRDDTDNDFSIPKKVQLKRFLKDVLETEVDEKYFLSDKAIKGFLKDKPNFNGKFEPMDGSEQHAKCITTNAGSRGTDNFLIVKQRRTEEAKKKRSEIKTKTGKDSGVFSEREIYFKEQEYSDTILANPNFEKEQLVLHIKANTKKGFETMTDEDSLNLSVPSSKTRRGRIGKKVAQTLDTQCNQGCLDNERIRKFTPRECFRFMDFPDTFNWNVSDRQAYKQAGNSIPVGLLVLIIEKLLKI